MTNAEQIVLNQIKSIEPYDDIEANHIKDAVEWISNSSNIFRISKPAKPSKHLVSYFVVYDEATKKIMLIDHIKAQAWLPTGGHVELNENPKSTVEREAYEELKLASNFNVTGDKPLFITVTQTKPPHSHTDVSLWYVISGDSTVSYDFDQSEMNEYRWFSFNGILDMDNKLTDPHMKRFTHKLMKKVID